MYAVSDSDAYPSERDAVQRLVEASNRSQQWVLIMW